MDELKEDKVIEIQLEWEYTPTTFVEEPIKIKEENYTIDIRDGKGIAYVKPEYCKERMDLRDMLMSEIRSQLQAIQMENHQKFDLEFISFYERTQSGSMNYHGLVNPDVTVWQGGQLDIKATSPDGTVTDTKKDRIDRINRLSKLFIKHADDETLEFIKTRYSDAVQEPKLELINLYDIRDALAKKFGSKEKAIRILKSATNWKILDDIVNNYNIDIGRHTGKHHTNLRPATKEELEKVRSAAQGIINKYLEYLESQS